MASGFSRKAAWRLEPWSSDVAGRNVESENFDRSATLRSPTPSPMNRRDFISVTSVAASFAALPRALGQWQPSQRYPDPSVKIIDPSFSKYRVTSAKVEKIASGLRWA